MAAWRRLAARRCARRELSAWIGRRSATSLPQIPGVIFTNNEIPEDRLVRQVRAWAASSEVLRAGSFDLLQVAEKVEGRLEPRALCGLLRTRVLLAGNPEPLRAVAALFCRSRDLLNREFWEDQARRLCDVLADEYLGGGRGLQLTVHHNAPAWALGLEVGDHRLLAELEALHVLGRPWRRPASAGPGLLDFLGRGASCNEALGLEGFNRLCGPEVSSGADDGSLLPSGHYVLRAAPGGPAICGLEVLGVLPRRILCGAPWAEEGREAAVADLLDALLRRARRPACSLLADGRDARWRRLAGADAAVRAFRRPGFRVHAQPVHPGMLQMQGMFGVLTSKSWPMTIGRGLREASAIIARLGGPDLTKEALEAMHELLVISLDKSIVGKYGAHSEVSKAAKARYDESATPPPGAPHLWLCGHFTAKSFALLLKLLGKAEEQQRFIFWQTKSGVQPLGGVDEWEIWQKQCHAHSALTKWGVIGGVTGHPGAVGKLSSVDEVRAVGGPEDYRGFMTQVQFPSSRL